MGSLLLNKTIIKHSQNALFEQKRKSNLLCVFVFYLLETKFLLSKRIVLIFSKIRNTHILFRVIFLLISTQLFIFHILQTYLCLHSTFSCRFLKKTIINYDLPAKNESEITMQGEGHFLLLICCFDNQFGKEAPRFFFFPSMIYLTIKTCKRNM